VPKSATPVISFYSDVGAPYFGFNTLVRNFNNCIFIGIVAPDIGAHESY